MGLSVTQVHCPQRTSGDVPPVASGDIIVISRRRRAVISRGRSLSLRCKPLLMNSPNVTRRAENERGHLLAHLRCGQSPG